MPSSHLKLTSRFANDLGYRMAKTLIGLYKENAFYEKCHQIPKHRTNNTRKMPFMKNAIKFLNIERITRQSLTNFGDHFGLHASVMFYTPLCVISFTCVYWYDPKL